MNGPPGRRSGPSWETRAAGTSGDDIPSMPRSADTGLLDTIHAAFVAGYDIGVAYGRNDRADDEQRDAMHDLACRTIGLRPDDADAPRWAVAS